MSAHLNAHQSILSHPNKLDWFNALPGETFTIRVDSQETNYAFGIAEVIIEPQAGPPLHIHHDTDEVLYVVAGTIDFICNGERFQSGPGGLVVIPKGSPHAFRNFGTAPARLLGFLPTGGLEQLFKAMIDAPLTDMPMLADRHHMEIVGPPLEQRSTHHIKEPIDE